MRVSNGMRPVHPGEILAEELDELGLSANALANALAVPTNRITAILKGQRGVTADTALRLSRYFGTTPQLWLNLQKTFELRVAEIESGKAIADRVQPRETAQVAGPGGNHADPGLARRPPQSSTEWSDDDDKVTGVPARRRRLLEATATGDRSTLL